MSTVVHAVTVTRPNKTGSTNWFWSQIDADENFHDKIEEYGKTATVRHLRVDVTQALSDAVEDLIAAGEAELVQYNAPDEPEKPEYTTLRYDTQNHEILYIERTYGGEFWAYTVEKQTNTSWLVKEQMNGERIGRVYQDDPTALLPSYSVELRADTDPVAYGASLQEAVEALIGTASGDFGDVK